MKNNRKKAGDEFRALVADLERDEKILKMRAFRQHGRITTYDHCRNVARISYLMARFLHIPFHEEELVRGAFLHDYFLYDWHHYDKPWHGFTHPEHAGRNADRDFRLTGREKNIIESHMWPLTPLNVPRSREAVLVNIADKICSAKETLFDR